MDAPDLEVAEEEDDLRVEEQEVRTVGMPRSELASVDTIDLEVDEEDDLSVAWPWTMAIDLATEEYGHKR